MPRPSGPSKTQDLLPLLQGRGSEHDGKTRILRRGHSTLWEVEFRCLQKLPQAGFVQEETTQDQVVNNHDKMGTKEPGKKPVQH